MIQACVIYIQLTPRYDVSVSYLEIYNESFRDLIGGKGSESEKLDIRETAKGVVVQGLTTVRISILLLARIFIVELDCFTDGNRPLPSRCKQPTPLTCLLSSTEAAPIAIGVQRTQTLTVADLIGV